MRMYVIYSNPSDYPGKYVARGFTIGAGEVKADIRPMAIRDSLAEIRAAQQVHR